MLIAFWSAKGGSGTTVVASSLALLLSRSADEGAVLVDLDGDVPAVLGVPDPSGPGATDFMAAGPGVPSTALPRLATSVAPGLDLIHRGEAREVPPSSADGERLAAAIAASSRTTVVDCGSVVTPAGLAVASAAALSLLVLRPCYLGLRQAARCAVRPSAVVLVAEPGRSIGEREITDVLGVPVRASIPFDPAVSRVVDAGLLGTRVPRAIERALKVAA